MDRPHPSPGPPPGGSLNGYLIERDRSDAWLWCQAERDLPRLAALREAAEIRHPGSGSLLPDLFSVLFKARPDLQEPRTPSQRTRHRILASVLESADLRRLRVTTRLRAFPAAVAAADLFEKILADWPIDQSSPSSPPTADSGQGLDTLVRRLLRAAAAKAEEAIECTSGWGTGAGDGARQPLAEVSALAERVSGSDLLRQIARLAGRMKQLAFSRHRVRVRYGTDEIVSIESGRDLARVLPQELVALRHPILRREFFRRFAEGALLQYRLEGAEPLGRGPMIVCLDSSASMRGDREAWTKALALALLHVAARERRDYALIHFGSRDELRVFVFDRGQALSSQVLDALAFAFHGGTDFERPLREAMNVVQASRFNRADVVFLTDGECQVPAPALAEILAVKAKRQVRIFSVLIDLPSQAGARSLSAHTLQPFSDEVLRLTDLSKDGPVLERAFARS